MTINVLFGGGRRCSIMTQRRRWWSSSSFRGTLLGGSAARPTMMTGKSCQVETRHVHTEGTNSSNSSSSNHKNDTTAGSPPPPSSVAFHFAATDYANSFHLVPPQYRLSSSSASSLDPKMAWRQQAVEYCQHTYDPKFWSHDPVGSHRSSYHPRFPFVRVPYHKCN